MDGIIILSLQSGMMLFSRSYSSQFGLRTAVLGSNPLQLSSVLYAMYKVSISDNAKTKGVICVNEGLKTMKKVCTSYPKSTSKGFLPIP